MSEVRAIITEIDKLYWREPQNWPTADAPAAIAECKARAQFILWELMTGANSISTGYDALQQIAKELRSIDSSI